MATQNKNLAELSAAGVSVWLDDLSRERLRTGISPSWWRPRAWSE